MSKTIIERMCCIAEKMRPEEDKNIMPLVNVAKARTDINALGRMLGVSAMQAVILTAIVQKSSRYNIDGDDIATMLGLDYLRFLSYDEEMEGLRKKGYIRIDKDGGIVIPKDVLNCLKKNVPVSPDPVEGLGATQVLSMIRKVLSIRIEDQCSAREAVEELEDVLRLNPGNSVSRTLLQHIDGIHYTERMLLFVLGFRYYHRDDDMVTWHDIDDYYNDDEFDIIMGNLKNEDTALQERGVVEFTSDDGLVSKDFFHIKDSVKEDIFEDVGGIRKKEKKVSASRKIGAGSIAQKELFYNTAEERQVCQLQSLLAGDRFNSIREKMREKSLRTGFTCLFYGAPGTGKTETVYQIARESGRDLFIVDVSQIKSCWVGESEKNIKGVFSKYRECVAMGGTVPILLFNEADAILGIRQEGAGSAVDKMENAIQNIILQEMEDLDGILIATTNLTCNLDKAFERRFLYKIRFDKPTLEAKSRIWRSMIPELSTDEALQLATDYDFSGGQIENVARKWAVKGLIGDGDPSYTDIRSYCNEEAISDAPVRRKIGF